MLVRMCGFGLYVGCGCTVDSVAKGICANWIGILGESCGGGTKVGLRMKICD
jgi:hypothetical protein